MSQANFHETYGREQKILGSSNRNFGLTFAVVFAILTIFKWRKTHDISFPLLVASGLFFILALLLPNSLALLNRAWTKFGLLLHKVMNPLVMGVIFFVVVTPMGILMRIFGGDPMRSKFEPNLDTYWIKKNKELDTTMKEQF